ncbi:MAG TPA: YciI family protein [Polyangia bacterium]|nr:YciI family protein [Polyangia bacterium]
MRFMMMVKSDAKSEAGVLPDAKDLAEMGKFNDELVKAGAMLAGEGLQASGKGTRIRYGAGKYRVIDGPFAETKELVAGFWLISAKSKAEAIDWAKRAPIQDGEVEIRPLYELEDFPVDPAEQPEGRRDQEQKFRDNAPAQTARKPGDKRIRYMGLLKADAYTEAGSPPNEKILAEMGALMDDMAKAGVLLSGEGLKPSSEGARVHYAGSKRTVIDGPFTETKELIAGYSIFQVKSKEEAIEWSKRFIKIHVDGVGAAEGESELRQLFELEDFPVDASEKPDGWRHQEQSFRERQS